MLLEWSCSKDLIFNDSMFIVVYPCAPVKSIGVCKIFVFFHFESIELLEIQKIREELLKVLREMENPSARRH